MLVLFATEHWQRLFYEKQSLINLNQTTSINTTTLKLDGN